MSVIAEHEIGNGIANGDKKVKFNCIIYVDIHMAQKMIGSLCPFYIV